MTDTTTAAERLARMIRDNVYVAFDDPETVQGIDDAVDALRAPQRAGEPVAWRPGMSIENRARELLEIELKANPAEPTVAALRAIEAAVSAEVKVTNALLAVWDDWITANDESGMDNYEIKDVAPETVQAVGHAIRGRLYAPSDAHPPAPQGEARTATQCCKGLAPPSECRCEQERLAQGHSPYPRSAAQTQQGETKHD